MSRQAVGSGLVTLSVGILSIFAAGVSGAKGLSQHDRSLGATGTIASLAPTLGRVWSPNQLGYGEVLPTTVFNGGDPTGRVKQIRWSGWGSPRAVGAGIGDFVWPGESVAQGSTRAQAHVLAYDLGLCQGQLAYRKITWWFPKYGETFSAGSWINICTGAYSPYRPIKYGHCAQVGFAPQSDNLATNIRVAGLSCRLAHKLVAKTRPARYRHRGLRYTAFGFFCGGGQATFTVIPNIRYECDRGSRSMVFNRY